MMVVLGAAPRDRRGSAVDAASAVVVTTDVVPAAPRPRRPLAFVCHHAILGSAAGCAVSLTPTHDRFRGGGPSVGSGGSRRRIEHGEGHGARRRPHGRGANCIGRGSNCSGRARAAAESPAPRVGELRAHAVRALGAPLLATTAVAIVLLTFFQPAFLTNDDTAVEAVINGDFTGKRSSALVIVPAIFGHILRVFYFLIPHLNWYAISLYTLQIVAWSVIAAMAFTLQRRPPLAERIVVGAIASAVLPWMILRIGYTPTSIFIGVAGILSFAAGALAPGRLGLLYTIVGGVFVGVVDFVRVTSLLGLLALFAPLLVVIAYKTGLRRSITFGLIVLSFMIVGYGTTKLEYARTPQWRAFIRDERTARPAVTDATALQRERVGRRLGEDRLDPQRPISLRRRRVSRPDGVLGQVHRGAGQRVAARSPARRASSTCTTPSATRPTTGTVPSSRGSYALGILDRAGRNRFVTAVIVASVVWAVAVLTVLLLYERLPGRIGVPFEAGAALLALIVPAYLFPSSESWPRTGGRPTFSSPAATAFVALVLLFTAGPVWRAIESPSQMSSQDKSGLADVKDVLTRMKLIDPKGIFVGGGNYFGRWSARSPTPHSSLTNRSFPLD